MTPSIYLVAAGSAWFIAQVAKYLIRASRSGKWTDSSSFLHSGSMPSVHTATVVALTTSIGAKDGVESAVFALSLLVTAIVAYDAMGVRRTAGEQGLALRQLLKNDTKKPYLAMGHTPLEVAVGAVLGVFVGGAVAIFTTYI
jgi:uncharacterized protein